MNAQDYLQTYIGELVITIAKLREENARLLDKHTALLEEIVRLRPETERGTN